jgi:TldD protein
MKTRRDFLKQSGLAAAGIAVGGIVAPAYATSPSRKHAGADGMPADDRVRALMMTALDAAKGAGASYADVRIGRYRNGFVATRERQITETADTDSIGAGVRALVDGTWGFAATDLLTTDGVAAAAREAVVIAKANRLARARPPRWSRYRRFP